MRRGFADGPAGAISYIVWDCPAAAPGQPLLCLHPVNTGAEIWAETAKLVSRVRPVVAFDYRAHGRSVKAGPLGVAHYAADGLAVIRQLGLSRVHLAAGSIGGAVAVEMLAAEPDHVLSIAAFGATLHIGLCHDLLAPMVADLRGKGVERWFDEHGSAILGPRARAGAARELTRLAVSEARGADLVGDVLSETFGSADARPTLGRLPAALPPARVAVGEHDPTCPIDMARSLAEALRAPEPVVLEGIGHLPMLEDPGRTATLIEDLCRTAENHSG